MSNSKCPVPKEQQPTNEYIELSNSLVFSLPRSNKKYTLVLITVWIICFLIFLIISSGSVHFTENNLRYVLISFFGSLSAPLLISVRLLLGWNHIFKRLIAERVEYEESGWYDGQIWIKPVQLKEKETLIAFLEVKPILKKLSQITSIIFSFILIGILIFQNINI